MYNITYIPSDSFKNKTAIFENNFYFRLIISIISKIKVISTKSARNQFSVRKESYWHRIFMIFHNCKVLVDHCAALMCLCQSSVLCCDHCQTVHGRKPL